MPSTELMIQEKAYALGYEHCGIIPLEKLHGYGQKMQERIERVPQSEEFYKRQYRLIDPQKAYPWAQSALVVIERYGNNVIPDEVKDSIGRHYLFDTRIDENTEEFQVGRKMESFMQDLGLKFVTDRKFGLVGLRWAAMKAGLGIIRRNNFFYTQSGSWVSIQVWLIDEKLEIREENYLPPCPDNCNLCIQACPSGSLFAPHTMSPTKCVSFLTTTGGRDLPNEPLNKTFNDCIYGCDICQNVCPQNIRKWENIRNFPGLTELAPHLTPESIMEMDDDYYKQNIQSKFFYLTPEELWKWKVNVLNFMRNNYQESYQPYIMAACKNDNEKIRQMAQSVCSELYG